MGDYPDADTFMHGALHSKEGAYGRLVGLPEIDAHIDQGRREADPVARGAVYRDIEATIAERVVLVPLFHDKTFCFARPTVKGLDEESLGTMTLGVDYGALWIEA